MPPRPDSGAEDADDSVKKTHGESSKKMNLRYTRTSFDTCRRLQAKTNV